LIDGERFLVQTITRASARITREMAVDDSVIIVNARGAPASARRSGLQRLPFSIEHITTPNVPAFDFDWSGASAYLALHDVVLSDGNMVGDDIAPIRVLDMRRKMTFLPSGVRVEGFCQPARPNNSMSVLYFDQQWVFDELETPFAQRQLKPQLYFRHAPLMRTLQRLGEFARSRAKAPTLLIDSLSIVAVAELLQRKPNSSQPIGLTMKQVAVVRDFVHAHLAEDISVGDMAAVVGMSVFHFARRFKTAAGVSPYRYVLNTRTEHAKKIMTDNTVPLATVAELCGFGSASHFAKSFGVIVGVSRRVVPNRVANRRFTTLWRHWRVGPL
jgi:AraC family transcriptional regulator